MKYRLRKFERVPTLFTLIIVAGTMALAGWQLHRLEWKTQLLASIDQAQSLPPKDLLSFSEAEIPMSQWRNVVVRGRLLNDKELYATPRYLKGLLGYAVLTPLAVATPQGTRYVLINRGWVAPEHKDSKQRSAGNVAEEVTIEGALRLPMEKKMFTPQNQPERNLWFWYDLDAMGKHIGVTLMPLLVDATAIHKADGMLITEGPSYFPIEINIRNDHMGYAITWFLIGLGALGVYLAYHLERR